jgi:hypothetical protein
LVRHFLHNHITIEPQALPLLGVYLLRRFPIAHIQKNTSQSCKQIILENILHLTHTLFQGPRNLRGRQQRNLANFSSRRSHQVSSRPYRPSVGKERVLFRPMMVL